MDGYTPGQVAEKSGFSVDTFRYDERIGLLDGVSRTSGGRRIFTDDDLGWLEILRCRVTLPEEHNRAVEAQVHNLLAQQRHLRDKIAWYRSVSPQPI